MRPRVVLKPRQTPVPWSLPPQVIPLAIPLAGATVHFQVRAPLPPAVLCCALGAAAGLACIAARRRARPSPLHSALPSFTCTSHPYLTVPPVLQDYNKEVLSTLPQRNVATNAARLPAGRRGVNSQAPVRPYPRAPIPIPRQDEERRCVGVGTRMRRGRGGGSGRGGTGAALDAGGTAAHTQAATPAHIWVPIPTCVRVKPATGTAPATSVASSAEGTAGGGVSAEPAGGTCGAPAGEAEGRSRGGAGRGGVTG